MAIAHSEYRTIRLVIQPGRMIPGRSYWSLHALQVINNVPRSRILLDGYVPLLRKDCTTEEIVEAIAAVAAQSML